MNSSAVPDPGMPEAIAHGCTCSRKQYPEPYGAPLTVIKIDDDCAQHNANSAWAYWQHDDFLRLADLRRESGPSR